MAVWRSHLFLETVGDFALEVRNSGQPTEQCDDESQRRSVMGEARMEVVVKLLFLVATFFFIKYAVLGLLSPLRDLASRREEDTNGRSTCEEPHDPK